MKQRASLPLMITLIFVLMALTFLNAEAVVHPKLIPDRVLVDIADDQPVQCTQDTCTQACQGALGGGFNGAQCVDGPGGLFCVCNSIAA